MKNYLRGIFFSLLFCGVCFAQTSLRGITPGTSKSGDVVTVFGQPARKISQSLWEYAGQGGIEKILIRYRAGSSVVDGIETVFKAPARRSVVVQYLKLSEQNTPKQNDSGNKLVEYFGEPKYVVLTYSDSDSASGVTKIGYYSREFYASALQRPLNQTPDTEGSTTSITASSDRELNSLAVSLPEPVYPPIARYSKDAQGEVKVRVTIDENGNVISAKAISGHPLLQLAALQAARAAKFNPSRSEKMTGILTYRFTP